MRILKRLATCRADSGAGWPLAGLLPGLSHPGRRIAQGSNDQVFSSLLCFLSARLSFTQLKYTLHGLLYVIAVTFLSSIFLTPCVCAEVACLFLIRPNLALNGRTNFYYSRSSRGVDDESAYLARALCYRKRIVCGGRGLGLWTNVPKCSGPGDGHSPGRDSRHLVELTVSSILLILCPLVEHLNDGRIRCGFGNLGSCTFRIRCSQKPGTDYFAPVLAMFPFITGTLANLKGPRVIIYVTCCQVVVLVVSWFFFPSRVPNAGRR